MKKLIILLILAAFGWSIPACTNRNNNNEDRDVRKLGDSLNHDTIVSPPMDTRNETTDTSSFNADTSSVH